MNTMNFCLDILKEKSVKTTNLLIKEELEEELSRYFPKVTLFFFRWKVKVILSVS